MAEVAAAGAGRQDQVVVGQLPVVEHDLFGLDVYLLNFAQQHLHIRGLAHQLAQGRGHVALRHQPGGHLVQQRLEQVEVALVDQGDPHRLIDQGVAGLEPGEAAAHDHHMGQGFQPLIGGLQFQEEAFAGHYSQNSGFKVSILGRFGLLEVGWLWTPTCLLHRSRLSWPAWLMTPPCATSCMPLPG